MTEQSDMARRPMVNLDGRTAIITGSGKGIGAAVAKCLASHGAAVVINYVHDAASAQRTVEDIHSLGGLAIAVQADVCDESQSSKLVGTAVDSFGGVDILVNNAFGRFSFDPRREPRPPGVSSTSPAIWSIRPSCPTIRISLPKAAWSA